MSPKLPKDESPTDQTQLQCREWFHENENGVDTHAKSEEEAFSQRFSHPLQRDLEFRISTDNQCIQVRCSVSPVKIELDPSCTIDCVK